MLLENLFDILIKEASFSLKGTLSNEGIAIKWEYDSTNADLEIDESELDHLDQVYSDDLEIIRDTVNLNKFEISEPVIEDTYISFYIEQ